jgi:hypothetical protein
MYVVVGGQISLGTRLEQKKKGGPWRPSAAAERARTLCAEVEQLPSSVPAVKPQ